MNIVFVLCLKSFGAFFFVVVVVRIANERLELGGGGGVVVVGVTAIDVSRASLYRFTCGSLSSAIFRKCSHHTPNGKAKDHNNRKKERKTALHKKGTYEEKKTHTAKKANSHKVYIHTHTHTT